MKLTDAVDTSGHGFREIEERNRLKAQAEAVAAARVAEAVTVMQLATFNSFADSDARSAAEALLEAVRADPTRFGIAAVEEVKPPVKVKQTTGMIRTIRVNMRDLLLGYESLSRVLPETERTELRDPIFHAVEALELMGRPA